MTPLFKLITENRYPLDEVVSALQKSIRRGLEQDAMFWASEMETRYPDYLWKRLQIISIEDIGIAEPQTVLYVAEMRKIYAELKKEYDKEPEKKARSFRMALANAILSMCRAKKSRIGDEFQIVIYGRRGAGWTPEVPDFAIDMHTRRGRQELKRGATHFWTEGVRIENEGQVENPYTQEAVKIRTRNEK